MTGLAYGLGMCDWRRMSGVFHVQETVSTRGKGLVEVTDLIASAVRRAGIREGVVLVMVRHTSASLVMMENADPDARRDLEEWFERMVPERQEWFTHTCEGPDDMPSHIRMALTGSSEMVPVTGGDLVLGTWQGIHLFEHRRAPHRRQLWITVMGQ